MHKICIYGAGAVGLHLALHFIRAGYQVTIVARNQTLKQLQTNGIIYTNQNNTLRIEPDKFYVTNDLTSIAPPDMLVCTLKSHTLIACAEELGKLCGENTIFLSASNGIPPWYSVNQQNLEAVLPDTHTRDAFSQFINPHKIIGVVIRHNIIASAPGIISCNDGGDYLLGELNHQTSKRLTAIKNIFEASALKITLSDNIHRDIWLKLLINIAVNPLSVIYEKSLGQLLSDTTVYQECFAVMQETFLLGCHLGIVTENDCNVAEHLKIFATSRTDHNFTSMYWDFTKNNVLETQRILDITIEIAGFPKVGFAVPNLARLQERLQSKKTPRNYFKDQAEFYYKVRPSYPDDLVEYVVSRCSNTDYLWDVATGSGQLATKLANHFNQVIATDISSEQIALAPLVKNITYHVESAEHTSLADHSMDLITIGQGVQWLSLEKFYLEVARVAKKNCIIAAFGARMVHINPEADAIIDKFIWQDLKQYWDSNNDQLHSNAYQSLYFPFADVEYKIFNLNLKWEVLNILALLDSYSASRHYFEKNKVNASDIIKEKLIAIMGNKPWPVVIPFYGKIGKVIRKKFSSI